jgi:IS5 family transposase
MSKNRFSKPVAFNKNNPDDQKILKHVARRNFSGYVKKLILADIEAKEQEKAQNKAVEAVKPEPTPAPRQETAAEKMARLREQIKKPSNPTPGPKLFTRQEN